MNARYSFAARGLLAALLVAGSAGCASMGTLEDVLAGTDRVNNQTRDLSGEVRQIDTRNREIQIAGNGGRNQWVRYDARTEVVYRQRNYAVSDLERGDLVRVRVEERGREPYARQIQVQQSVQDRADRGPNGRVQRIDGEVVRIDSRRGWFEVQQNRGGVVTVTLPSPPSRVVADRFNRLRRGDRVRVEARAIDTWTLELRRFL